MSNRLTNIIAAVLLAVVLLVAVFSIKDDSFTFDETAHIAAGYSYLTQKDMRLNPEHPPLVKDLAAIPLLFLNLSFPKDHSSWTQEDPPQWWTQFDFASQFLYKSGNNPNQILFWSRIPVILLLLFLGWFLFYWTKKLFGNKTALLALFFFSFSPTFLAHGRLITTDVGAASGVVLATCFWLKFLKSPIKKNIVAAGLTFGLAMLLKFSLVLLIPFFAIITLIYVWLHKTGTLKQILKYAGLGLLAGVIGMVFVVWPVYQFHISNYPAGQQFRDAQFVLSSTSVPEPLINLNLWMAQNPVLRPFSQYFLGLLMATNRSATGNTTYFLGEISAAGWKNYFPIVYSIKEPLAFHILTLIALLYAAWLIRLRQGFGEQIKKLKNWLKSHFPEFALLVFIGIYWLTSLTSSLNIGVRHLLPVFPFTFILVSLGTVKWIEGIKKLPLKKMTTSFVSVLLGWYIISSLSCFPYFLAYSNELTGGPDKTYIYTVDSNLDWGQDLKRLKNWINEYNRCAFTKCPEECIGNSVPIEYGQPIDKIYVDYFGGGDAKYYLKEKYAPWWGQRNEKEFPKGNYLAISATFLQGGRGEPAPGFNQPYGYYRWLDKYQPITKIGYSIFVYYID